MKFIQTPINGAYVIEIQPISDERGFFSRMWCRQEFQDAGLKADFEQHSISFNRKRGTLRGMHFQLPPHDEVKIVRCSSGAIWDVILDLRPESTTFRQWFAIELSSDNRKSLYVPAGCAHGFQTLSDDTEVLYQISERYHSESARGVRWDDSAFGIAWPLPNPILSVRDSEFADFDTREERRSAIK